VVVSAAAAAESVHAMAGAWPRPRWSREAHAVVRVPRATGNLPRKYGAAALAPPTTIPAAVFVSAARKIQSTWVRAASGRGSATSQAWSGGNLVPAVQCRHVGGGQARIPALLVRHPSRAVVDEAVTEHLIDGIVNGLVAHFEHRQQVLT
jgi:hypothetical protein